MIFEILFDSDSAAATYAGRINPESDGEYLLDIDHERVCVYIFWHPDHEGEFITETMARVSVVDCQRLAYIDHWRQYLSAGGQS